MFNGAAQKIFTIIRDGVEFGHNQYQLNHYLKLQSDQINLFLRSNTLLKNLKNFCIGVPEILPSQEKDS